MNEPETQSHVDLAVVEPHVELALAEPGRANRHTLGGQGLERADAARVGKRRIVGNNSPSASHLPHADHADVDGRRSSVGDELGERALEHLGVGIEEEDVAGVASSSKARLLA